MMFGYIAARVAPSEDNSPQVSILEDTALEDSRDLYELKDTLDGYEVEAVDGHDLARYLPRLVFSEEDPEELESEPIGSL